MNVGLSEKAQKIVDRAMQSMWNRKSTKKIKKGAL